MGRRKRWAVRRHQPARGSANRQTMVASSSSKIIAPRWARDSKAASAHDAHDRSAGLGARRPVGRLSLRSFFEDGADPRTAELHASLTRKQRGAFLTPPLGMAGAVLERVVVDEPIKVVCQLTGHCGGATGAGATHQALDSLVGEAMDPRAQRRRGQVQRVGYRLETVPLDGLAHGLGTAEEARFLRLLRKVSKVGSA